MILRALSVMWVVLLAIPCPADNPLIPLGVSVPLTGSAATYGSDIKNILLFANERIGAGRYRFVFEDDRCAGREAVTVAKKFAEIERVRAVAAIACSTSVLASAEIYRRGGVVVMSPTASAPKISALGDYVFRTWVSDAKAAEVFVPYVQKRYRRLGILSEQTDAAQGFASAIQNLAASSKPLLTVVSESYLTGESDFRSLLLRLRDQRIDSLLINPQSEQMLLSILGQVRDLRIELPILSNAFAGSRSFLEKSGAKAEEIVFVDLPELSTVLHPEGRALYQDFQKQYGPMQSVELTFASVMDSFTALDQAIQSGNDLKQELHSRSVSGLLGKWRFDEHGDIVGPNFVMKRIHGGVIEQMAAPEAEPAEVGR